MNTSAVFPDHTQYLHSIHTCYTCIHTYSTGGIYMLHTCYIYIYTLYAQYRATLLRLHLCHSIIADVIRDSNHIIGVWHQHGLA